MPVLAGCTEPLAPDAVDMRGRWLAYTGLENQLERIEQCGNRVVVSRTAMAHDFRTDGTLANGISDVSPRKGTTRPGRGLVVRTSSIGGAENAAYFAYPRFVDRLRTFRNPSRGDRSGCRARLEICPAPSP